MRAIATQSIVKGTIEVETSWLTVREVAGILRTTATGVGKMIKAGTLPAVYVSKEAGWRIKASDVEALPTTQQKGQADGHPE